VLVPACLIFNQRLALSATYSNLENHPRLIQLTQPHGAKKIRLDPKTGLPSVMEAVVVEMPELSESGYTEGMEPSKFVLGDSM
jgi:hypothetical protein